MCRGRSRGLRRRDDGINVNPVADVRYTSIDLGFIPQVRNDEPSSLYRDVIDHGSSGSADDTNSDAILDFCEAEPLQKPYLFGPQ